MRPRTYNMDLIRFSCLMLVIKLKEGERDGGGGFVHPLLWPRESQTPKFCASSRFMQDSTLSNSPAWLRAVQLSDFVEGLEEISTRSEAQCSTSPARSALVLPDLHQSGWTGHLVPGTVVLSLNKTLASLLHRAAHVLIHDVGAPVPGVKRKGLGKLGEQCREGGDELTQQVGGHQRRRQELAKAATPGCLLCVWNTKDPQTLGNREVFVFGLGGRSPDTPHCPSPLQDARGPWWGAHGNPGVVTPQKSLGTSLLPPVDIGRAAPEFADEFGSDHRRSGTLGLGGEHKGRTLTCSWHWASRGTRAASSRGTVPRRLGPAGPAGPASSGWVLGVGAGSPDTS